MITSRCLISSVKTWKHGQNNTEYSLSPCLGGNNPPYWGGGVSLRCFSTQNYNCFASVIRSGGTSPRQSRDESQTSQRQVPNKSGTSHRQIQDKSETSQRRVAEKSKTSQRRVPDKWDKSENSPRKVRVESQTYPRRVPDKITLYNRWGGVTRCFPTLDGYYCACVIRSGD